MADQLIVTEKMMERQMSPVNGSLVDLLKKYATEKLCPGYISVNGTILPQYYEQLADEIENFEVYDDDVWVCGFPKTGTTWTQEMVWSIANNLDFQRGKVSIDKRFPCFEFCLLFDKKLARSGPAEKNSTDFLLDSISYAGNMPRPRFIKTHLPPDLLPRQLRDGEKKPKIIYVCRNPKDTCISCYHFAKLFIGFPGSFEDHCALFLGDIVPWGPFWKNVLGFWNKRNDFNMLSIKYEDMQKDLPSVIRKTAMFLGKNLTDDQVSLLTEHLSFSSMKVSPAVNHQDAISVSHKLHQIDEKGEFMRCGKMEQWKTVMTPDLIRQFDDWTYEHSNGTGVSL